MTRARFYFRQISFLFCFKGLIVASGGRAAIWEHDATREIRRLRRVHDVTFTFAGRTTGKLVWLWTSPLGGFNALHADLLGCPFLVPYRSWIGAGETGKCGSAKFYRVCSHAACRRTSAERRRFDEECDVTTFGLLVLNNVSVSLRAEIVVFPWCGQYLSNDHNIRVSTVIILNVFFFIFRERFFSQTVKGYCCFYANLHLKKWRWAMSAQVFNLPSFHSKCWEVYFLRWSLVDASR